MSKAEHVSEDQSNELPGGGPSGWEVQRELLLRYGKRAHPLFNLEHDKDSLDIIIGDERYLIFPRSNTEDRLYDLFLENDVLQFVRVEGVLENKELGMRHIPRGTKPLSQALQSAQEEGGLAFGKQSLFYLLGESLAAVRRASDSLPLNFQLSDAAYIKQGNGYVCLVPPVRLSRQGKLLDIVETIRNETIGSPQECQRCIKSFEQGFGK